MYVPEFLIPLKREDLCEASSGGQYYVKHIYSTRELNERLDAAKSALLEEGPSFIVDHFQTFYSFFQEFKHSTDLVNQKAWYIISKAMAENITKLNILFDDFNNIESDLKNDMRNITKMICYVLFELMGLLQDKYSEKCNSVLDQKGKRKPKLVEVWDWTEENQTMLKEIHSFIQLPIKLLWDPPVVEDEFVNLIANYCYKCLEDTNISSTKMKCIKETIFQIFGSLIKNYLHGLSYCVKIIQLLKSYEHLVNPIAKGTVQLLKEYKCTNIVKEIVREITDTDGDQLAADTSGTRSLNQFIVQLAESVPEAIIPAIDFLVQHLAGDSYTMRICVLEVLGEILIAILSKENLSEELKKMRDEFLDCLQDHVHDVNAFVRSKVLQIWQKLCTVNAIPISRFNHLLELVVARLNDKSANVKKQAIHLVRDLLERNPYSGQLNSIEIENQLKDEIRMLEALKKEHGLEFGDCDSMWKSLEPKLEKILDCISDNENECDVKENEIDVNDFNSKNTDNLKDLKLNERIEDIRKHLIAGNCETAVKELVFLRKKYDAALGLDEDDIPLIALLKNIFLQKMRGKWVNMPVEVQEKLNKHITAIEYLENSLKFAELIDHALPIISSLLDSNVVSDVLESSQFFTAAYLFGFHAALEGVRKMLYLMYSKEDIVKSAVSDAYKSLYLEREGQGRHGLVASVKNLSDLILNLNSSQLDALELVVRQWTSGGLIDGNFIQVMFERFSRKISGTTVADSWASLVLIRMVASEESRVIKSNISVLLSQGLSNVESQNFLIAKETCTALLRLKPRSQESKFVDQSYRYPTDHEIFIILKKFLRDGLWRTDDVYYTPMVEEAINLVFQLCDKPDSFCEHLIGEIHECVVNGVNPLKRRKTSGRRLMQIDEILTQSDAEEEVKTQIEEIKETSENIHEQEILILSRFLSILGHVAANYILFLEGPVLNELKLRNQLDFDRKLRKFQEKKNRSMRNKKSFDISRTERVSKVGQEGEDLEFNRIAADEMDAEELKKETENEVVTGNGYLAKFAELILAICKNPGKYNSLSLQNAALIALAKFMTVSSIFCEDNLQLLVTICGKSHFPEIRKNAIISLGALQYRFPSTLEPWTPHMYGMLRDPHPEVRLTAVMVLTDLIVNEMIKVRTNISDLALCIVDKDINIARMVRYFFKEYSIKGNSLFNVLPCLISNLTRPDSILSEEEFKTIMKFILELITKDKQSEHLIDKLFQYFESATTERQWKDLSFCLSLLNYNEKGLKKILDNARCFGNKLYLSDVYEAFNVIITNVKKNPQKDKSLVNEIQDFIKKYHDKCCQDKNFSFSEQKKNDILSISKRTTRKDFPALSSAKKLSVSRIGTVSTRKPIMRCKREIKFEHDDEDNNDNDDSAFMSDSSVKKSFKNRSSNSKRILDHQSEISDDDDTENCELSRKQSKKIKTKSHTKRNKGKCTLSDDTSEEEKKVRVLRSNRKRK